MKQFVLTKPCCYSTLGGSEVEVSACNAGDLGLIPGSGRSPGERNSYSLQYSCLESPVRELKSLVGYSPWGRKLSDMTERVTTLYFITFSNQIPPFLGRAVPCDLQDLL